MQPPKAGPIFFGTTRQFETDDLITNQVYQNCGRLTVKYTKGPCSLTGPEPKYRCWTRAITVRSADRLPLAIISAIRGEEAKEKYPRTERQSIRSCLASA